MDQPPLPPPQYYPPPPPPSPQPQPARPNVVGPILIGCMAILVVFILIGSVGAYFAWRAVSGAVHTASEVAQVAKGAEQSAQQVEQQAGASPNAHQQAQTGLNILKSFVGGGKRNAATLSREELKAYLPASAAAMARTNFNSSSGGVAGITGTNATADYSGNGGSLEIQITDAVNMSGLTAFTDLVMNAVQNENDEGYEKNVQFGDVKVHEKWQNAGKHADLFGIVGSRFVVSVTSNGVDMSTAEQAFQAVDLGKLSSIPTPEANP